MFETIITIRLGIHHCQEQSSTGSRWEGICQRTGHVG
jgi:hypothetical protein